MKIKHVIFLVIIILISVFVCGVIGWVVGANIGGNVTTNEANCQTINGVATCKEFHSFVYQGLPGYEGTGMLGLQLGALIGLVAGIYIGNKKYRK